MGRQLSTKRAASSHECRRDVRIEHTVHTGSNMYCVCQPSDINRDFSVLVKIEGLENHARPRAESFAANSMCAGAQKWGQRKAGGGSDRRF